VCVCGVDRLYMRNIYHKHNEAVCDQNHILTSNV
jgi:hypothetical protein